VHCEISSKLLIYLECPRGAELLPPKSSISGRCHSERQGEGGDGPSVGPTTEANPLRGDAHQARNPNGSLGRRTIHQGQRPLAARPHKSPPAASLRDFGPSRVGAAAVGTALRRFAHKGLKGIVGVGTKSQCAELAGKPPAQAGHGQARKGTGSDPRRASRSSMPVPGFRSRTMQKKRFVGTIRLAPSIWWNLRACADVSG